MTADRTTATARYRRPLVRAIVVGLVTVALIAIGVTSGHAGASPDRTHAIGGQDDRDVIVHEEPPENATYRVSIPAQSPEWTDVYVSISYEARSTAELERARNKTLATEWFRGGEIVREAMAARGLDTDAIERPMIRYEVPEGDDADTITIHYRVLWTDIPPEDDDRVRFGPGFAAALEPGDEFRVDVFDNQWEDWAANRDPATKTDSEHTYVWTIGEDPDPEIALDRGNAGTETDGGLRSRLPISDSGLKLLGLSALVLLLGGGALALLVGVRPSHRRWS